MKNRKNLSTGAKWESIVGYSRAVRIGNLIEVAGTAPVRGANELVGEDNPFAQAYFCLEKIQSALEEMGGSMEDVVRTRIYVTDASMWEEVGRAHGAFFKDIRPATTLVEVSRLVDPSWLVEIEATAVVEN